MDLQSPTTLAAAWVLAPLVATLTAAGLGAGMATIAGVRLGALTLPTGFVAGIAVISPLLELEVPGIVAAPVCAALALGGGILYVVLRPGPARAGGSLRRLVWPTGAALAAYGVGIAPVVLSGHSRILGYLLNNDVAAHLTVVSMLIEHGSEGVDTGASSYHSVGGLLKGGYPIGSHVWPMFASLAAGVDTFHVWTPLIAVLSAMLALVGYELLRGVAAPTPVAAIGGAVVACGYLPYSYLVQGSAKEIAFTMVLLTAVALFAAGRAAGGASRALLPAATGAAAAVDVLGLGAGAWLAPAGALVLVLALLDPGRRSRVRAVASLAVAGIVAGVLASPAVVASLLFVSTFEESIAHAAQAGNLLGAVPPQEVFNLWFGYDYRHPAPSEGGLTLLAIVLAAPLAVAGLVHALRRRALAVPLAVAVGALGTAYIASRYAAIYFTAKTYVMLAPALGLATVAGVIWLFRRDRRLQGLAAFLGVGLAGGVMLSAAYVFAGVWLTPVERFEQMAAINERFAGRGPMLVNEREDYAKYLLRDVRPFESWSPFSPNRGLRGDEPLLDPGHTPDFDDYLPEFAKLFPLMLERKRPGGSRPPGSFRPVYETSFYRVWQRAEPPPVSRLPLGPDRLSGDARLSCASRKARAFVASARRERRRLRVAWASAALVVGRPENWTGQAELEPGPLPELVSRRGGYASVRPVLEQGKRYRAYMKGSFTLGMRLIVDRREISDSYGNRALFDSWQPLGDFTARRSKPQVGLLGLTRPWWQPGSRKTDLSGPVAFVPLPEAAPVQTMDARRWPRLCGRSIDWVEAV